MNWLFYMQCYFSCIFINDFFVTHVFYYVQHDLWYNKNQFVICTFLRLYAINCDDSLNCCYLTYITQPVFRHIFKNHKKIIIVHTIQFSPKLSFNIFSIYFTIHNIHARDIKFKIINNISYGLYFSTTFFSIGPILYQGMNNIYLSIPEIFEKQITCPIFIAYVNVSKSCCYV